MWINVTSEAVECTRIAEVRHSERPNLFSDLRCGPLVERDNQDLIACDAHLLHKEFDHAREKEGLARARSRFHNCALCRRAESSGFVWI
jgi:hypothetical protein